MSPVSCHSGGLADSQRGKAALDSLRQLRTLLLALLLSAVVAGGWEGVASAQQAGNPGWSTPVNLSNSSAESGTPAIAADATGTVHVFWGENLDPSLNYPVAIMYTRWDGTAWLKPVDVLMSPEGPASMAREPAAVVSADGRLHVLWVGGWTDSIYYSSAPAGDAGKASVWTHPLDLSPPDISAEEADIALDPLGSLHAVYLVRLGNEQGVYHTWSEDGGLHWSSPAPIPGTRLGAGKMLENVKMAIGSDGAIHVVWVWADYPENFPPKGILYTRSADSGKTWSDPLALADGPFAFPAVAALGEGEVHVVWSGTEEQRSKFHRWSADGGATWSVPVAVLTPGGFQGDAALAVDSGGTLHWMTVSSRPGYWDPLMHLTWDGASWKPEVVMDSRTVGYLDTKQNEAYAAMAIAEGNRLHVVLQSPLQLRDSWQMDVFYVTRRADAPWIAPEPLPTAAPTPTASAATEASLVVLATSVPTPGAFGAGTAAPGPSASRTVPALLIALITTLALLGGAVLVRLGLAGRR